MKVEVRCPDCKRPWYVDQSATGEMLCPGCMTRIPLDGSATAQPDDEAASAPDVPARENVHVDSPPVAGIEPAQPVSVPPPPESTPTETIPETPRPAAPPAGDAPSDFDAPPIPAAATSVRGRVTGSALEAATDAAAARKAQARAAPRGEQVVCPRCNLHFELSETSRRRTAERKTILVVDDLAYFREIAKDALEPAFDVKTAATSAEARELIRAGAIDLLVLDLTLDGCNAGRELLAELRPKPCPILIFTAQDESEMYGENWESLKRLGADDLVIKGMRVAESLARKASSLLGVPLDDEDPIG
jgi:CheY-like chemotaxis protein/uncharacterized protein YbaR (Trm112 family)